jgi:cell division protease FtsH
MDNIKIKFSDIIGQNNAVNLIKEYLDIVKNFQKYKDIGAKIPKGALLHGPPGTGKTLLAKALAGESNLPFVSLSGSDLNAMFVGLGALKVKNLFEEARKKAEINKGCIVFIDEIDAIGQKRGTNGMNVNTERENTLNQLLTEMDGFEESKNIIILGATNRYEMLDPALLRPGRFDRKILVDLPNLSERRDLFKFYFNKLKTDIKDEELSNIIETSCKLTPGFSGADISNICNESAIISIRENNNTISENNIKKAIDYVMLGSEKENILSDKEKEIVAYHEAGHALISHILENTPNPIKVSITPREKGMLGFSQSEYPEQVLISKQNIEDQICVLMAGRICENIFINDITNGASNDIEKASELINKYLKLFCMSEENKFYKIKEKENSFNNEIGFKIKDDTDSKSIEILNQLYKKTENLILNNIDKIEKIKESLIEKETIYKNEIDEIIYCNSHPNKNYKK